MMRTSTIKRKTNETDIKIKLNIDGKGSYKIDSSVNFLNHMLELFAKHGAFNLELKASGDLDIDQHHTIEDVGIVLGLAFKEALGNKKGINRAGYFVMPMDESQAVIALDISGRSYLKFKAIFKKDKVGDLDSDLLEDFFQGFASSLGCNVQIKVKGRSEHHKAEAIFKGFGRALRAACSLDKKMKSLPSTKGLI